MQSRYFGVVEAELKGWIMDGYYVPSLIALSTEGEEGSELDMFMDFVGPLPTSSNKTVMPDFSSRGFATVSIDTETLVCITL